MRKQPRLALASGFNGEGGGDNPPNLAHQLYLRCREMAQPHKAINEGVSYGEKF